jgi:hypothetical protein
VGDARSRDGCLGNLDANRLRAGVGHLGRELAASAAQVKCSISAVGVSPQKAPPEFEVGRCELVRKPLPDLFVVILDGPTLTATGRVEVAARHGAGKRFRVNHRTIMELHRGT